MMEWLRKLLEAIGRVPPAPKPKPVPKPSPVPRPPVVVESGAPERSVVWDDYPDRTGGCQDWCVWRAEYASVPLPGKSWTSYRAHEWDEHARSLGIRVDMIASVGAFVQFEANEVRKWRTGNTTHTSTAGSGGHVAYVERVFQRDGKTYLTISEYNGANDLEFGVRDYPADTVKDFIHWIDDALSK